MRRSARALRFQVVAELANEALTSPTPELGTLLELLHRADAPFTTVRATYRIWRHDERAGEAFRAAIEEEKRRGAAISSYGPMGSSDAPAEHEEQLRLWRSGDRVREEREGGPRDRSYGVRVGNLWWMWDQHNGAASNEDDPKFGSAVGEELSVMLDPTWLLGALRFRVLGRSQQAGRATITAEAVPRPSRGDGRPRAFELHELGGGADRYTLDIDAERGVLLGVVALRNDEPFHRVTTLEITFDEPIPDERFEFQPPAGEEIRAVGIRTRPAHVPLTEARQRAPFTVLIPDRIPSDWQLHCVFLEPSDRPPAPAQVSLQYRSVSGHESVSLSQTPATDRPSIYDEMTRSDHWEHITRGGTDILVTKPGATGGQVQAQLERDGTFVFLMSETLSTEQLTTIAAGLRPAPSTSSF
jgi:hypothetical protein